MDHTVIDTGHHRLLIATRGAASANDRYRPAPPVAFADERPLLGRDGKIDVLTKEFDELLDIDICQIDGQHLPVRASDPNDTIRTSDTIDDEKTTVVTSYRERFDVVIHFLILPPTRFPSVRQLTLHQTNRKKRQCSARVGMGQAIR